MKVFSSLLLVWMSKDPGDWATRTPTATSTDAFEDHIY